MQGAATPHCIFYWPNINAACARSSEVTGKMASLNTDERLVQISSYVILDVLVDQ